MRSSLACRFGVIERACALVARLSLGRRVPYFICLATAVVFIAVPDLRTCLRRLRLTPAEWWRLGVSRLSRCRELLLACPW